LLGRSCRSLVGRMSDKGPNFLRDVRSYLHDSGFPKFKDRNAKSIDALRASIIHRLRLRSEGVALFYAIQCKELSTVPVLYRHEIDSWENRHTSVCHPTGGASRIPTRGIRPGVRQTRPLLSSNSHGRRWGSLRVAAMIMTLYRIYRWSAATEGNAKRSV
jgi:hypothetical protein